MEAFQQRTAFECFAFKVTCSRVHVFKPPAPPPLHPTTTPPIWCPIPYPIDHSNNQGNQIPVHRDAFPLTDLRMNYADPRDILTCEQAVLL